MIDENLSEELLEAAESAAFKTLPEKSKERYLQKYEEFDAWKIRNNAIGISEKLLMAYFYTMSKNQKPTTLWATYSMMKSTIKLKHNVDISTYHQLCAFLKTNASGYRPEKANVFTESEIEQFLDQANDYDWLDVKVSKMVRFLKFCIFLISTNIFAAGCNDFWNVWGSTKLRIGEGNH